MLDEHDMLMLLADHLGRHSLAWYGVLMLVSLASAAMAVRMLSRRDPPQRGRLALWPMPSVLVLNLLIGFAVVVGAAATFVELAEALRDQESLLGPFDDRLARTLAAHVPDAALQWFGWVTHFGDVPVLAGIGVVVTGLLVWQRRHALALFWAVSLAGNGVLIRVLKGLFERVRPEHDVHLAAADGWSFPSGHTAGSLVGYGLLAYLGWRLLPPRWRMPVVLAATAIAVSVGVSRVFLRVHHASDVLAGWATGGAWLIVSLLSVELARRVASGAWWQRRTAVRG